MYCVHTLNTKKIHSNLTSLNTFIKETSSPNVKLSKVGSNAIVLVPVGAGPTKTYITPADPEATEQKREKTEQKLDVFSSSMFCLCLQRDSNQCCVVL
jgi:hypothetical protein